MLRVAAWVLRGCCVVWCCCTDAVTFTFFFVLFSFVFFFSPLVKPPLPPPPPLLPPPPPRRLEQRERRKELSIKLNLMDPVLSEVRARDRGFEQFRNSMRIFARFHEPAAHKELLIEYLRKLHLERRVQQIQHYRRWGLSTRSDVEHFKGDAEKRKRDKDSRGKSSTNSPARARMHGLSGSSRKTSTLAAVEALPGTGQLAADSSLNTPSASFLSPAVWCRQCARCATLCAHHRINASPHHRGSEEAGALTRIADTE